VKSREVHCFETAGVRSKHRIAMTTNRLAISCGLICHKTKKLPKRQLRVIFSVTFMRVKLIRNAGIEDYIRNHASSRSPLDTFRHILKYADWEIPEDIASTFGKKYDLVCNGNRIVFDVGGGKYRVICGIAFRKKNVFLYLKFIGTHAEYDKLCHAGKNETGICNVDLYKS
jgi:mRNA interferase HigB